MYCYYQEIVHFMHDKKSAQQTGFTFNIYYAPKHQKYILFQSMYITTPDFFYFLFFYFFKQKKHVHLFNQGF